MSQAEPVGSSRQTAIFALVAMVALLGGLIGLSRFSPEQSAPTFVAAGPTSSPSTFASPSPTAAPTATPGPTAQPMPTPTATPLPSPRPTDGLTSLRVLTTTEFQDIYRSGQFAGATLVVRGRLDADTRCLGVAMCTYSNLAGAWIAGPFPLPVRTHHTVLPVAGDLVLHIRSGESAVYVGRVLADPAGDVWTPAQVGSLDKAALESDEVVLVDGWLGQSTIRIRCAPIEAGLLPRHFCGRQAWISAFEEVGDGEPVLGVQPNAYFEFAPRPRRDPMADVYVPRHGLMALGVRFERDGCFSPPCAAWHVLGWITAQAALPTGAAAH